MTKAYRHGAVGALLNEYERTIVDLQQTIADISDCVSSPKNLFDGLQ